MVQMSFRVNAGKVLAGVKTIARDMPKVTKKNGLRVVQWILERVRMFFPEGPRGGYTAPWTAKQAKGEKGAYQRTGDYGRGWKYQPMAGSSWQIFNTVPHSRHVGGDSYGKRQAAIHRGRWYVARDVAVTGWDVVLRQYLEKDLKKMIRDEGIGL